MDRQGRLRMLEWTERLSLAIGFGLIWWAAGWRIALAVLLLLLSRNARQEWEWVVDHGEWSRPRS